MERGGGIRAPADLGVANYRLCSKPSFPQALAIRSCVFSQRCRPDDGVAQHPRGVRLRLRATDRRHRSSRSGSTTAWSMRPSGWLKPVCRTSPSSMQQRLGRSASSRRSTSSVTWPTLFAAEVSRKKRGLHGRTARLHRRRSASRRAAESSPTPDRLSEGRARECSPALTRTRATEGRRRRRSRRVPAGRASR